MAKVTIGGRTYDVDVRGETVVVDGREFPVTVREDGGYLTVKAGEQQYRVELPPEAERVSGMSVQVDYRPFMVQWEGNLGGGGQQAAPRLRAVMGGAAAVTTPRAASKGGVTAQITGRITSVRVKPGDAVQRGDVLLLLEAMKMENEIKAPTDGTVKEVLVSEGQRVNEGDTLVVVE